MPIQHFSQNEDTILHMACCTGYVTDDHVKDLYISNYYIQKLVKNGLLERDIAWITNGFYSVYHLTPIGKQTVLKTWGLHPYKYIKTRSEHDYILGKIYVSLPIEIRMQWLTETCLNMSYNASHKKSPEIIDAMIVTKDDKIGIEVITPTYSKERIALKESFINNNCSKSIIINTKENK